jgi:non-ribosomal peptide synthase protein (TIGR01720 family)
LRYLRGDEDVKRLLQLRPQPEVSFNYLGQVDRAHRGEIAPEEMSTGSTRSLCGRRRHKLEINGSITNGQLTMVWTYSKNYHRPGTIEKVAEDFIEALRALITHCQSSDAGGYTPSDFPDVELTQHKLDTVLAELDLD